MAVSFATSSNRLTTGTVSVTSLVRLPPVLLVFDKQPAEHFAENLAGINFWELCSLLGQHHIKKAEDFYEYLCATLPAASHAEPSPDEDPECRESTRQRGTTFVDKAVMLVVYLEDMPKASYYALRAYVLLLAKVLQRKHKRVGSTRMPYHSIHQVLNNMLKKRCLDARPDEIVKQRIYLDIAAAVRQFTAAMSEPYSRIQRSIGRPCYHEHDLPALTLLQKYAWGEIRAKVFLIVGQRLPAELT